MLPESLHIIPSLWVALRGPVVDSARVNEPFVLVVEEPLGSNVVKSLVQKHKGPLETSTTCAIVACLQLDTVAARSAREHRQSGAHLRAEVGDNPWRLMDASWTEENELDLALGEHVLSKERGHLDEGVER